MNLPEETTEQPPARVAQEHRYLRDSEAGSHRDRIDELRSIIRDQAYELNSLKAKTGAAFGGAVFALLLASCAAYDLIRGNLAPWLFLGLDRQFLILALAGLGLVSLALLAVGVLKLRPGAIQKQAELEELEREYETLLDSQA
ncbi:MAG TPA: hypothetical protein VKM94_22440 [Blastocatellia bacterium]|nr:hypothetical protein [Blastocatellia bacterium]